jgi:hypothetical protein
MRLAPLSPEAQLMVEQASRIAVPRVSDIPEVQKRFTRALHEILVRSSIAGGRMGALPSHIAPRREMALRSFKAFCSASRLDPRHPAALQEWMQLWSEHLQLPAYRVPFNRVFRSIASRTAEVRSGLQTVDQFLLSRPAEELAPSLFDSLVGQEEQAEQGHRPPLIPRGEPSRRALPPPSGPKQAPKAAKPAPASMAGYSTWSKVPDEPTLEGRLRRMRDLGGTLGLGAEYAAEILHIKLDPGPKRPVSA